MNTKALITKFRKPIIFTVDILSVNLSMYLAFLIRFDGSLTKEMFGVCVYFMILASMVRLSLFAVFGIYQWAFRHASISEIVRVATAVTLGSLLLILTAFFTRHMMMGRSVLLIDYLICLFIVTASRFMPRALIKFKQVHCSNLEKVLIIGAGSAGEMVVREMINTRDRVYDPVGYIDDDPTKLYSRMHGIRVLGATNDIKNIVESHNVDEIIIAIPSASGKTIRDIVSKCENVNVKIKTVPAIHKILTGEVSIKQVRDVSPEDLLGRETVEIDVKDIKSLIKNKVVLITGAGGSVGSELCRQIAKFDPGGLILFDHNENDVYFLELALKDKYPFLKFKTIIGDIKDIGLLKNTFSKNRPQIIFHSAAHKHVPLMEENPVSAVKNNVMGTRNLIYASEHYGVESFVMISTDKAVNPTSVMGASKRVAEMMLQAKAKRARTKFMAVRFGNVIGSSGSVVRIFKNQIEIGGPVTVTHPEVKRFFMTTKEAVQLVIQAAALGKGGEIFVLDMGEQIKIADLAKNLITLSGFEPGEDIEVRFMGLRPGEKMGEETLLDAEHDKATKHNKIYVTQSHDFDMIRLRKDIKELDRLANLMAADKIITKIKEMVPGYGANRKFNGW